jgi:hypothetical protein
MFMISLRWHDWIWHAGQLRDIADHKISAHIFNIWNRFQQRFKLPNLSVCVHTSVRKSEASLHGNPHARLRQRRRFLDCVFNSAFCGITNSRVVAICVWLFALARHEARRAALDARMRFGVCFGKRHERSLRLRAVRDPVCDPDERIVVMIFKRFRAQ